MNKKKFSFRDRLKSFRYAITGIFTLVRNEHNARIHLFVTFAVLIAGILCKLSREEWIAIVMAIGFVFSAEAFNSSIEYLSDKTSPEHHPLIKKVKDIAAAGVLFSALAAAIVGLLIFLPKIQFL